MRSLPVPQSSAHTKPNRLWLGAVIAIAAMTMLVLVAFNGRFHIIAITPANGSQLIPTTTRIDIRFSTSLAALPTDEAITLSPPVPGEIAANGRFLSFIPSEPLQPDTTYTVTISRQLAGSNGRNLWWPHTFSFTTAGPQIAFLDTAPDGTRQLFILDMATRTQRQLTSQPGDIDAYAISPDGSRLAYSRQAAGNSTIHVAAVDGRTDTEYLACGTDTCTQPLWAPDSQRLIYERRTEGQSPTLWWLDVVTQESIPVLAGSTISHAARFSPDGRWISYVTTPDAGIQLYNFQDGRQLTLPSDVGTPAIWNPNGRSLLVRSNFLYVAHGDESEDHLSHSHDYSLSVYLFSYTLDGATTTLSEGFDLDDANPAFSPNGDWIAFTRKKARVFMGRQLWLMHSDGRDAHPLTDDYSYHIGPPSWSADGRFLLFQRTAVNDANARPSLWLLEMATGQLSQLSPSGYLPGWID